MKENNLKPIRIAWKIISTIGKTLWGMFIAFILIFMILFAIGIRPNIVLSGSMEPNIQTGSICFVNTKTDYEDIKAGDIIAFKMGEKQVTHRAIAITKKGIETKGDNNDISDGITTTKENFIGETVFSIPHLGYLFQYVLTKKGKIAITCLFALVIICTFISDTKKKEEDS